MNSKFKKVYSDWFRSRGWKPFPFQTEVLEKYLEGYHGLLNAPTGSGKTYAMWLPVLMEFLIRSNQEKNYSTKGLQVLWITPVRALANDIKRAMDEACRDLGIEWEIGVRTGDTSSAERAKQKRKTPQCLITTPESMHLMIATKNYPEFFRSMKLIVIDEWHELLGTKRGVQVELGLSRLKSICEGLRIWGISATIGNLEQALEVLLGEDIRYSKNTIVRAKIDKNIEVETVMPAEIEKFPWGGHLGIQLLPKVLEIVKEGRSTLIFTNTRSQSEIWYQRMLAASPDLAGWIAIHHGSLADELRRWVENALHTDQLKVVVCTSSLDLGVDFRPVETVVQIGGPKGIARFIQRAGRSGHRPGATSKIFFVPTNSLELIEAAALRFAIQTGRIESRDPLVRTFDVLVQYLVTLAVSDGFDPKQIYQEVRETHAFNSVSEDEWGWCMQFITNGGNTLDSYEEFKKVEKGEDGLYRVNDRKIALRHRLSMGTIVSDAMMTVKYAGGTRLGVIEEGFITKLKPGDVFSFAGKMLEVVKIRDMIATVKRASSSKPVIPQWLGGKMSLSSQLSDVIRQKLSDALENKLDDPELKKLKPLFDLQVKRSTLPKMDELLIETFESKEGFHLFIYPFEGRYVNEGIAALIGYRISKIKKLTYSISINDYGFELLSDQDIPLAQSLESGLFSEERLMEDIQAGLNSSEMARRKFRDIAHIAGLIFQGYPGRQKKNRQLQASSRLFFDVFTEYEPDNLLLLQAYDEVKYLQLDEGRMRNAIQRINTHKVVVQELKKPSPFCFPLMVERFRDKMTTEKLEERVRRLLKKELE